MNHSIRLLHLEDDPRDAELIRLRLKAAGLSCDIMWVNSREAFESTLDRESFDLLLSDYNLPDYDGMLVLARVRQKQPELPVIMISGGLSEEEAVDCLKAGATDYVLKQRLQRLGPAVRRALAEKAEQEKRLAVENALQASEERFRSIAEATHEWIFELDAQGIYTYCSSAAETILGYTPEELIGRSALDHVYRREKEDVAKLLRSAIAERRGWRDLALRMRHKDGSMRCVDSNALPLLDPQGDVIGYRGVARDITERIEQQEKIIRLSRIHSMLSDINSTIVRTRTRAELFAEACRIAVEDGGFRLVWIGLLDANGLDITPVARAGVDEGYLDNIRLTARQGEPDSYEMVAQAVRKETAVVCNDIATDQRMARWRDEALRRGFRSVAVLPLCLGGKVAGLFLLYAAEENFFDTREMRLLTEIAGDIAFALDHLEKAARLDYLAYYDSLTGLANRTLFLDRLGEHLVEARNSRSVVALVLMNIDRFKMINDTLGRAAGDELLRQIAGRVISAANNEPGRIARIGGDIFGVMTFNLKSAEEMARLTEQRIEEIFGAPFEIGGTELRVSARFGIAVFPDDGGDAETLFKNAEAALKKAKVSGERYLFYTQKMTTKVAENLALENQLRQALEKEQFVLHYQPKVDLETRSIVAVEALIRWMSPKQGLVPPFKFIPLLEETGLVLDVGAWALRQAAQDHRYWVEQGLSAPRVAVNVSPVQLRQADFVASLEEAIRQGVSPHGLDLEITESVIMEDIDASIGKLRAARDLGIGIAIDDFGTGYSSLAYLAKLPVQTLKIDRSFIITMLKEPDVMLLVQTMISLAQSLRLKVVAEGVEEEEQAKMLRLLRCDQMQGYLFSQPVPRGEITAMLKQAKKI